MNEEELQWLKEISTTTGISYSGDMTITTDFANELIDYIKELEQLQNNWNELKKCVREWITYYSVCDEDYKELNVLLDVESKMQELEQGKDE